MGTDLCQYGNHNINFNNRSYREVAIEIKEKLDNFKFINEEYLKYLVITREEYFMFNRNSAFPMSHYQENIERFKNTKKWEWDYRITEEKAFMEIELRGFLDFNLYFYPSSIYFSSSPPYRYSYWFNCDNVIRDEWRKYMFQIIKLFGGNRVIYLPDQGYDHYLDYFDQIPFLTFEEIESKIEKEDGLFKGKIEDFYNDDSIGSFCIDYFHDLELVNKLSIDEFILWVKDK